MTLIDAGPLIAVVNKSDRIAYEATRRFFTSRRKTYVTTLVVLGEAMHMVDQAGSWPAQDVLWDFCDRQNIRLLNLDAPALVRCRVLMEQYRDRPMDFGDASLVVVAESRGIREIVTIDRDFYIYRINGREAFDVINPLA